MLSKENLETVSTKSVYAPVDSVQALYRMVFRAPRAEVEETPTEVKPEPATPTDVTVSIKNIEEHKPLVEVTRFELACVRPCERKVVQVTNVLPDRIAFAWKPCRNPFCQYIYSRARQIIKKKKECVPTCTGKECAPCETPPAPPPPTPSFTGVPALLLLALFAA